ncbi:hypothetical protein H1P_1400004 [Hyella patelloides LEGE 07179]|uniref:Uncharacterized protein n=1 Tax=Hyella patelloides LEGE 07179 TaxID=945734 RepID=A0A563VLE8_9CYAN|nr:hypothetical protein [Hyella patelloides]VEP12276.1 hypothetical protein H1P_1400004 [Hyella patelloides LEGE 07179]
MKTIPKIRGYIATKKNIIVFLYRRSNKITYLISLDYQKGRESIQIGSRFYGRIYPNRCDISPDGTYFLYFAMGKSQQQYEKKLYCWTGICMPPKITANMLFAHQDTWGGGGRFVDDKTIFISPGMYPDFDKQQNHQFDNYQITFKGKLEDAESWTSGKGWKLTEKQIVPSYGDKYPIPKCWTKTNGKITLIKHLNYSSYLKSKNGQTIGSYDLHSYEIRDNKNKVKYSLNDESKICLWADFDNLGRLIVAQESEIFIYQNFKNIIDRERGSRLESISNQGVDKKYIKTFDFEKLITLPHKK